MIKLNFNFERYKQALRLQQLVNYLMSPCAAEPEIEPPHTYNLIDHIIVVGGNHEVI